MTFEPQNIEAVRAYWASYQKLEQEGLVVGTALEDNREDQALGQAWRRCEAALPEGWIGPILEPKYTYHGRIVVVDYQAAARNDGAVGVAPSAAVHLGPTPTAALEALAEKLEGLPR